VLDTVWLSALRELTSSLKDVLEGIGDNDAEGRADNDAESIGDTEAEPDTESLNSCK
jgi:hypothetical protein